MVYETIVGRTKEDLNEFGSAGAGFIGKHIVGSGEDAHLTTSVYIDLLRPHVILLTGKRGTGKSYVGGVIAEEISRLPEEYRQRTAVVFVDTMGIFWSMKRPNDQQAGLLREWKLEPRPVENVKVYVPFKQVEEFERSGIPVDGGISIAPSEFSAEEWRLAFNLRATEPAGVALEKTINELAEAQQKFSIDDIITKTRDDEETAEEVKDALQNMLTVAKQWGVFGEAGEESTSIDDIVQPGQITIIDVSRLRATEAWSVRNFIVAIVARKLYQRRLVARKEEEIEKLTGEKPQSPFPMVWLIVDESHNFCPADGETISSEPLRVIAKQGREPGASLVVITQMPNRVHQDILSQCDIVIAHRLTSRDDLQALHSVAQAYHEKELWQYVNSLPRGWVGSAAIIDDNLEKVFSVQIRPRTSWHAGGTAVIV